MIIIFIIIIDIAESGVARSGEEEVTDSTENNNVGETSRVFTQTTIYCTRGTLVYYACSIIIICEF